MNHLRILGWSSKQPLSFKSELSNNMFFFPKAEQKFEEAVEKAKDAQAMFAEYLGRQQRTTWGKSWPICTYIA